MSKGTYCLLMELDHNQDIGIGRRTPIRFPKGYYCYVGSAMNNLGKRIDRHLSKQKRFHWHIDWFLDHAPIIDVKRIESSCKLECSLSREIARFSEKTIMKGFGSSDCSCETHLHYFRKNPARDLNRLLKKMAGAVK
ncbi:MAG: GIY-YIG nuclease family protein [Deltaproteobacteria bacterium]|nr:GIY-YIG nuclease family protein [Deltaproteobacteria bacterium]MBW2141552.1 GIY-YIG nuclease family protein [Deltaproteobacteria bacterium]MBW2324503.1 GIY-YIG nuclease family protein [Deltaproteobacteria bacterium]